MPPRTNKYSGDDIPIYRPGTVIRPIGSLEPGDKAIIYLDELKL